MGHISAIDEQTGRKLYLYGGGSVDAWQRAYFPAVDDKGPHRQVVATPSAAGAP